jgi:hypothetical protein
MSVTELLVAPFSLYANSKRAKTYNSGDSPVVTHLTTSPPVHCLYEAERTGSLIFSVLWSYVEELVDRAFQILLTVFKTIYNRPATDAA